MLASYLVTADHSPEAATEFAHPRTLPAGDAAAAPAARRLRLAVGRGQQGGLPAGLRAERGGPRRRAARDNRGKYYKNVRSEWASLVATPPSARFQDTLAFTRSLGDLRNPTAWLPPDVRARPRRAPAAHRTRQRSGAAAAAAGRHHPRRTDGIWDNWKYDMHKILHGAGAYVGSSRVCEKDNPGIFVSRHSESRSLSVDLFAALPPLHSPLNPFFLLLFFLLLLLLLLLLLRRTTSLERSRTRRRRRHEARRRQPTGGRGPSGDAAGSQQFIQKNAEYVLVYEFWFHLLARRHSLTHSPPFPVGTRKRASDPPPTMPLRLWPSSGALRILVLAIN